MLQCEYEVVPNKAPTGLPVRFSSIMGLIGLLRASVTEARCEGRTTLALTFSSGVKLLVHDSEPYYESFVITAPGVTISV